MLSSPGAAVGTPHKVNVSIYVYNIGSFNVESGLYEVDFYLHFKWDDKEIPDKNISNLITSFDLMNGRSFYEKKLTDDPGDIWYRVSATIREQVNLRNYPIDNQTLTIQLENSNLNNSVLVYIADRNESDLDPEVGVIGWEIKDIKDSKFNISSEDHNYQAYNETYTRIIYKINIVHQLSTLLKTILPAVLLLVISLAAFLISHDDVKRLGLLIAVMIATFQQHNIVSGALPPTPYITLIDAVIISVFVSQVIIILVTIFHLEKYERYKLDKLIPLMIVLLILAMFRTILSAF